MSFSTAMGHAFINKVKVLQRSLNELKTSNDTEALVKFENQLTLDEIETCFVTSSSEALSANLSIVLAKRWERIRGSIASYTEQPFNPINQLCLELAQSISPLPQQKDDYDHLAKGEGPYFVIMPSLRAHQTVYGENIHQLQLNQFVLSDNEELFIPIVGCLRRVVESDLGEVLHIASEHYVFPKLTPTELGRVVGSSLKVEEYYNAIQEFNKKRFHDLGFGSHLTKLVNALRAGGAHARGEELNAAAIANEGIAEFAQYWDTFSEEKKAWYCQQYRGLKDILGNLMRPTDAEYQNVQFCIELIADDIDPIIDQMEAANYELIGLKERITVLQKGVIDELDNVKDPLKHPITNVKQPKVLSQIFALAKERQEELFQHRADKSVLMYALDHEPHALPEYLDLLDAEAREQIAKARLRSGDTPVITAAKEGANEAIAPLLTLGVDIEAEDVSSNRALHWAANNGHVNVVQLLLQKGAQLDAPGRINNTALHYAITQGNAAVVNVLLECDANIMLRNSFYENVLGLAIKHHPELVPKILLKAITLIPSQQEMLLQTLQESEFTHYPYPNVLFYAARKYPQSFEALVAKAKEHNDCEIINNILRTVDFDNSTALLCAARVGSIEAARTLLEWGASLNGEMDREKNTALHYAARMGHGLLAGFLLENKANVNALDYRNNTALHIAARNGHAQIVDSLLSLDADITLKNMYGENALDLAVQGRHQRVIDKLLLKAVLLSPEEQKSLLSRINNGVYDNVLIYAMCEHPTLLETLLEKTGKKEEYLVAQGKLKSFVDIDKHIDLFQSKLSQMRIKAQHNDNYPSAIQEVKSLINALTVAKAEFLFKEIPTEAEKKSQFKYTCLKAAREARPVLEQHRELKKIIAAFFIVILTLPVSLPLMALGVFSLKTQSEQSLNTFEKDIDSLPVEDPSIKNLR
ncbi:ankyrin repeat domain-containing protein [Legionella fallonii]|uniref:Uncharacterized protein n=1 Tax=Legionella fallonii LLAP-10 TaxID=1212491 RepID=A0A098G0S6_9GAMM|nr:ankyrin repeat domain-containing protein [Legionella fallonii]CEG56117.1 protein of unknown function [ankyrin repeat] [Legionella fallonii LLAP-10]